MKKLLTLVLALIMVFAVAAPAMALTKDHLTTISESGADYFGLDVAVYRNPIADWANGAKVSLPVLRLATDAYVQNEMVYVGIILTQKKDVKEDKIPTAMKITSTYELKYAANAAKVYAVTDAGKAKTVAATDVFNVLKNQAKDDGKYVTKAATFGEAAIARTTGVATGLSAKNEVLYIFAEFKNGTKDFEIKVELVPALALTDTYVPATTDGILVAKLGTKLYAVTDGTNSIAFKTDDANRVASMAFADSGSAAVASFTAITSSLEYDTTYTGTSSGYGPAWNVGNIECASAVVGSINGMFKALSFDINKLNTGAVKESHFLAVVKGTRLEDDPAKGFFYTAAVTIPDVVVQVPPKTGDASTMAGFVMIAAAIVAALGLAYNKVRA